MHGKQGRSKHGEEPGVAARREITHTEPFKEQPAPRQPARLPQPAQDGSRSAGSVFNTGECDAIGTT